MSSQNESFHLLEFGPDCCHVTIYTSFALSMLDVVLALSFHGPAQTLRLDLP